MPKEQETGVAVWEEASIWEAIHRTAWRTSDKVTGELCTILDAVIVDERQVKATKDITKQTVRNAVDKFMDVLNTILYQCKKNNTPMLPEWLEDRLKRELS